MPPTDTPGNLGDAMSLAQSYLAGRGVPLSILLPQRQPVSVSTGLAAAIDFATRLAGTGRITFAAIKPDVEGRIGATFEMPAGQSAACQWLAAQAEDSNLYFGLNEAAPQAEQTGKNGCPNGQDVRMLRGIAVDVDPDGNLEATEAGRVAEQARLDALVSEWIATGVTAVVHSGGGRQGFWFFPESIPATPENVAAVEAQAKGFAKRYGGDKVQNRAHLFRLPGTTNRPDAGKRSRGRVERKAEVIHVDWSRRSTLAELARIAPPAAPPSQAQESDWSSERAAVSALTDELDFDGAAVMDGPNDWPAELQKKIASVEAADSAFSDLLRGVDGAQPRDGGASDRRARLAAVMGRHGFSAQDYCDVVASWPLGEPSSGNELTVRDVAREWVRIGEPAAAAQNPASWFEAITGDVDVSMFATSRPADVAEGTVRRGLPAGVEPITSPPDARAIPVRSYLIEPRLSQGAVTEYVGEPGVSKSTAVIWDAIVIASGDETVLRGDGALSPERLHQTGPVIIYNAEDSHAEMLRRLRAAMSVYGIPGLKHPIYLWSGLDHGPIIIVKRDRVRGVVMRAEGADQLAQAVQSTGAVHVALDPLAKLASGTSENDTDDMNALTQELARDAARLGVSIALVHHTAKHTRNMAGDMGAGRGAFSVAGGVRGVWTLCNVSPDDAKAWGISARDHVRLDHAKANHGRKLDMPILLRRENAAVGNGRGDDTPANHQNLFDLPVREELRQAGDRAPVLRVVGVGRPTETTKVERRAESNNLVAQTVLEVIGETGTFPLSAVRERLSQALRQAGLLRGTGREAVNNCLHNALGGEAQTGTLAGQTVRTRLRKDGMSPTAPWVLLVETASTSTDEAPLSALSISETDKTYKTENAGLFD
ncbi:MAG: AAA family ATPase [Methylobacteriaceae bacterium]